MSGAERENPIAARRHEQQPSVVRHEEDLQVGAETYEAGSIRARKRVETEQVERVEPRLVEYGDVERAPADDADSGEIETLDDGSISIPLFEERLVVKKELFVRERVIVRKRTVTEHHRIEADLRKEHIDVEGDLEEESAGSTTDDAPSSPRRKERR
jgi:uncharacterized protein (TIGR02271 family)